MKKAGFIFLIMLSLTSCEKFEMRGFVAAYEAVDERFDQSMDWNSEHNFREIIVTDDNYSIFSLGDSHVGGTVNLRRFFQDAKAASAIATVLAGDVTTGHADDYDEFYAQLPEQHEMPSFSMVGNHDLYFDGWTKFRSLFGTTTFLFTVKTPSATDLYICMDSGSGTLGSSQLFWLKNILADRSDYRRCVIFTHNNLFRIRHTFSTNPFVEEIRELADICVRYNVDMVVTGHDHQRNVVTFGNTVHITMDALEDINEDASYLVLDIGDENVDWRFVDLP